MPPPLKRVLFLNRSYYPDAEATGQLLTQLCEDLAPDFNITVIAGQPNQNPQNIPFRRTGKELHNGVEIRRVYNTRFRKSSFLGRAVNYLSFLAFATFAALIARRPDVIIVESDPPLLCLLGRVLRWRFRCKSIVYLQDIYPHLAVALGKLPDNRVTKLLEHRFAAAYRRADRVVVLSADMRDVVIEAGVPAESIVVIPNWIDATKIQPTKTNNPFRVELDIDDKFVVMYSGNLGLCQGLDNILDAAEHLSSRADIVFLLVGDGAARKELEASVAQRKLTNVTFVNYQPLSRLGESLSAADLHLVPVDGRVYRYLMPSKLYGVLASATPVLTVAPPQSELAQLVTQEKVGANVIPDQPIQLADQITTFADSADLTNYSNRARSLAISTFDRPVVTNQFRNLLNEVLAS